jgi:hypothetical protein
MDGDYEALAGGRRWHSEKKGLGGEVAGWPYPLPACWDPPPFLPGPTFFISVIQRSPWREMSFIPYSESFETQSCLDCRCNFNWRHHACRRNNNCIYHTATSRDVASHQNGYWLFFACGSKSIVLGSWVMTRSPLCFHSESYLKTTLKKF